MRRDWCLFFLSLALLLHFCKIWLFILFQVWFLRLRSCLTTCSVELCYIKIEICTGGDWHLCTSPFPSEKHEQKLVVTAYGVTTFNPDVLVIGPLETSAHGFWFEADSLNWWHGGRGSAELCRGEDDRWQMLWGENSGIDGNLGSRYLKGCCVWKESLLDK